MKELIAIPLRGVGEVKFGMSRMEVRDILGAYKEFKKSKYSKTTTDDFDYCHVYYNQLDQCEAIEIFEGTIVKIGSEIVFPLGFKEACQVLNGYDEELEIEEDGCTSIKASIGVYATQDRTEAILFGCEGYYE